MYWLHCSFTAKSHRSTLPLMRARVFFRPMPSPAALAVFERKVRKSKVSASVVPKSVPDVAW